MHTVFFHFRDISGALDSIVDSDSTTKRQKRNTSTWVNDVQKLPIFSGFLMCFVFILISVHYFCFPKWYFYFFFMETRESRYYETSLGYWLLPIISTESYYSRCVMFLTFQFVCWEFLLFSEMQCCFFF